MYTLPPANMRAVKTGSFLLEGLLVRMRCTLPPTNMKAPRTTFEDLVPFAEPF